MKKSTSIFVLLLEMMFLKSINMSSISPHLEWHNFLSKKVLCENYFPQWLCNNFIFLFAYAFYIETNSNGGICLSKINLCFSLKSSIDDAALCISD